MQLVTDYCRYLAIETLGDVDAIPDCPAELSRSWTCKGLWGSGFSLSGFRGLGFRDQGLGFRGFGGFRVMGLG